MIEESEQLMRTTCVFVCRPYHVRVKPSRHASDRAAFKRVRTPHARPSVLKEPCAKSSCADANPTRGSDPSQGGLPFEHTGSRRARAPRPGRTALAGRGTARHIGTDGDHHARRPPLGRGPPGRGTRRPAPGRRARAHGAALRRGAPHRGRAAHAGERGRAHPQRAAAPHQRGRVGDARRRESARSRRGDVPAAVRARPVRSPPVTAAPSSLLEILRAHGLDRHPLAGAAAGCPCRDARGNGSGAHRRGAVARVAERAREPAGTVGHRLLLLHRHHRLPLEPGGLSPSERRLFSIVSALDALGGRTLGRPSAAGRNHRFAGGICRCRQRAVPVGGPRAGRGEGVAGDSADVHVPLCGVLLRGLYGILIFVSDRERVLRHAAGIPAAGSAGRLGGGADPPQRVLARAPALVAGDDCPGAEGGRNRTPLVERSRRGLPRRARAAGRRSAVLRLSLPAIRRPVGVGPRPARVGMPLLGRGPAPDPVRTPEDLRVKYTEVIVYIGDIVAFFVAAAAIRPVARRLGIAYALWIAINIFPPVAAHLFISVGRFTAVLFPMFFWLALVVPRPRLARVAGTFAVCQAIFAVWFFLWRPVV